MYGLHSMKYHGTISLPLYMFHNLLHYLELNSKLILLTNIDSLYPISFFSLKKSITLITAAKCYECGGGGELSLSISLC